jgi:hypothetical protein
MILMTSYTSAYTEANLADRSWEKEAGYSYERTAGEGDEAESAKQMLAWLGRLEKMLPDAKKTLQAMAANKSPNTRDLGDFMGHLMGYRTEEWYDTLFR